MLIKKKHSLNFSLLLPRSISFFKHSSRLSFVPVNSHRGVFWHPSLTQIRESLKEEVLFLFYLCAQLYPFQTLRELALSTISFLIYCHSLLFQCLLLLCEGKKEKNKHRPKYARNTLKESDSFLRDPQTCSSSEPTTKRARRGGRGRGNNQGN